MKTKHIIIVEDSFFKANLKLFSDPLHCKVTKTIVDDGMFENDPIYKDLLSKKKKAEKELRDYEFNIRHNFK
jgi:hypothetical protein